MSKDEDDTLADLKVAEEAESLLSPSNGDHNHLAQTTNGLPTPSPSTSRSASPNPRPQFKRQSSLSHPRPDGAPRTSNRVRFDLEEHVVEQSEWLEEEDYLDSPNDSQHAPLLTDITPPSQSPFLSDAFQPEDDRDADAVEPGGEAGEAQGLAVHQNAVAIEDDEGRRHRGLYADGHGWSVPVAGAAPVARRARARQPLARRGRGSYALRTGRRACSRDPTMFRFLLRLLGFVLLAGGFVALVYDGARSVANNGLRITPLSELLFTLFKDKASALQATVEGVAPWLWNLAVLPLTLAPASLLGLGLGAVLLWLGQPAREPIGFLTRS